MSKSTQPAAAKPRKKPFFTNDDLWGYAFIGVAVIFFLMFTIYPLISAVITSLEDYKPFGSDFVGLKNYQTTFTNALFWKSLKNTLVYTAVVVPLSLLISFAVAILIMPFKKKLQSVFKAMYYLPAVASGIALSVVWLWIYDSSPSGLFNQLLTFFHLPTQNWLGSSKTSMLSLMIMALLSGQGQNIIIYTAALLGIDNTYFEAAELDGATFMQKVAPHRIPAGQAHHPVPAGHRRHRLLPGVHERLHDDRRRPGQRHHDDRPADLQQRLYL